MSTIKYAPYILQTCIYIVAPKLALPDRTLTLAVMPLTSLPSYLGVGST
jgi:hypothetical protein